MKLLINFFCLIMSGCSTYVQVHYQVPAPIMVESGRSLRVQVEASEDVAFAKLLKQQIQTVLGQTHWWKVKQKKSASYQLWVKNLFLDPSSVNSQVTKSARNAHASIEGHALVSLERQGRPLAETLNVHEHATASSEVQLPERKHGRKSLRPLIEGLMGVNEYQNKVEAQDDALKTQARANLALELAKAIVAQVTPTYKQMVVRLEEGSKDIDPAIDFAKQKKFDLALDYLKDMPSDRVDVVFNRAVFLEAVGNSLAACPLYEQAYQMERKPRFKKLHVGCRQRALGQQLVGQQLHSQKKRL